MFPGPCHDQLKGHLADGKTWLSSNQKAGGTIVKAKIHNYVKRNGKTHETRPAKFHMLKEKLSLDPQILPDEIISRR